jgi:predicted ATP-grasp superfamily ATP-dependent carboligase
MLAPTEAMEVPKWDKKKAAVKARGAGNFTVNVTDKTQVKREVDRILDKINDQGFGALSSEEKKILDKAKDLL